MRVPIESRVLLALAAALIPREARGDWRREWDAEIWWWLGSHPGERRQLFLHCTGALRDAACLRAADGDGAAWLRRRAGSPAACLAMLAAMLVAAGTFSGLRETRRMWHGETLADPRLLLLSQSLPFMGAHYGVPPRKLEDWEQRAQSLEGAAFYRSNGEVGAKFFELLGTRPAAGTLAGEGVPAAVLSYETWQRRYRGAAGVVGSTMRVGGAEVRIAGVLPREFWFLDLHPDVWIVSGAPGSAVVPAVARLRAGFTAAQAQQELRALAAQVPPASSGSAAVAEMLSPRGSRPWRVLGIPWLAMVCGSAAAALVRFRRNPRFGMFLAAKIVLALGLVLLAMVEFGSSWMVIRGNDTNLGAGAVSLWLFLAAPAAAVYWCWREQRLRCRHCLHRLTLPVSFGEGARLLIERSGTELVCPYGHGTLFTSDGVEPGQQWSTMDGSWRGLFAGK